MTKHIFEFVGWGDVEPVSAKQAGTVHKFLTNKTSTGIKNVKNAKEMERVWNIYFKAYFLFE